MNDPDDGYRRLHVLLLIVTIAVLALTIWTMVMDDGFRETPEGSDAVQVHQVWAHTEAVG